MDGKQKKLLSHIVMVMAPLLVLLSITVAWFISSQTVHLSEMSFASQDTGPGAVLYQAAKLENRTYTAPLEAAPATLAHDITWGKRETIENSHITIEDMLPGQCEYFLLVSDGRFIPQLTNVKITPGDAQQFPALSQCLGLYLLPTAINLDIDVEGQTDPSAKIEITRADNGILMNAVFQTDPIGALTPTAVRQAYILAVYCDPVYGQNGKHDRQTHAGTLTGSISFSLSFDSVKEGG